MDEALIELLSKKKYDLITVKDVCKKAGVNRSTFYLHYESFDDLLKESIAYVNEKCWRKFKERGIERIDVNSDDLNDLILINEKYLVPYLEYIRENQKLYSVIVDQPQLFQTDKLYREFFENIFDPILRRFGFSSEDNLYIMEYYIKGSFGLIMRWVAGGCKEEISKIVQLLLVCIRPSLIDKV